MPRLFVIVALSFLLSFNSMVTGKPGPAQEEDVDTFKEQILEILRTKNSTSQAVDFVLKKLNIGPAKSPKPKDANSTKCYSRNQIFQLLQVNETDLSPQFIDQLSPLVLEQVLSDACLAGPGEPDITPSQSDSKVFAFAFASVAVVSSCALIGAALIPLMHTKAYAYCMKFLLCLAIATLLGDAIIHIIPEVIGDHDEQGVEDHHSEPEEHSHQDGSFWKSICMCIAIYLFYTIQSLSILTGGSGHGHSHGFPSTTETDLSVVRRQSAAKSYDNMGYDEENGDDSNDELTGSMQLVAKKASKTRTQTALRLLTGGGLHNFTDGIAIGASFALSPSKGLSTSLAILFHEIPHEFGDIAMLISIGFSMKKALLLNLVTAVLAFAGVSVGILVSGNLLVRQWIFSFTAGTFIYIALVDVMTTVLNLKLEHRLLQFTMEHLGMLTGFTIMGLIAVFEDQLTF